MGNKTRSNDTQPKETTEADIIRKQSESGGDRKPIKEKYAHIEVDFAKTIAVFCMVFSGVAKNICNFPNRDVYKNIMEFIGAPLVAPIFMFAIGMYITFSSPQKPVVLVKKGIKLILTSYALNFFRYSVPLIIEKTFSLSPDAVNCNFIAIISPALVVDILQFAGFGFLFVALMKKLGFDEKRMFIFAVFLQGVGVLLSNRLTFLPESLYYVFGLFVNIKYHVTIFPSFIWLIYTVSGICFAKLLQKTDDKRHFYFWVLVSSAIVCFTSTVTTLSNKYNLEEYYNGVYTSTQNLFSTIWILSILGVIFSLCYFLSVLSDNLFSPSVGNKVKDLIKYCSDNLTPIYVCQGIIIAYMGEIFDLFNADNLRGIFIFPLGILLTVISVCIIWAIQRFGKKRKVPARKKQKASVDETN